MRKMITMDFETYYAADYSLRSMTYIDYILDPRFKVHGASVAVEKQAPRWVTGIALDELIQRIPWAGITLLGHNLMFDAAILAWRYGAHPAHMVDTICMSRFIHGPGIKSHALGALHEHLTGIPAKQGNWALNDVKGVRDPSPAQLDNLGRYAVDDAVETRRIYDAMAERFSVQEYDQMDWTIRMFTQPQLMLDVPILTVVEQEEIAAKADALAAAGVIRDDVMSNPKFADLLRTRGIEPPTKVSKTTGKVSLAFAKSDKEFLRLAESDDPVVRDLMAARLKNKTTIEETRARRFMSVADKMQGRMPVALQYCGASQAGRLSATQKMNQQNLGRKSRLREAITAPPGQVLVVADLAAIELRVNMLQIGQLDVVQDLRNDIDVYCKSASVLFGRTVTKADQFERLIGKIMELSLGYLAGHKAFRGMLWAQARRDEAEEFCQQAVRVYRGSKPKLREMSNAFNQMLAEMAAGIKPINPYNAPVEVTAAGIILPGGFTIKYPDLKWVGEKVGDDGEVVRRAGYQFTRYGGQFGGTDMIGAPGLLENPSQGLARCVLADMQARIKSQTGMAPVLQVHDELVYVTQESHADGLLTAVLAEMHKAPEFWPELPVKAEGGIGYRYSDAK